MRSRRCELNDGSLAMKLTQNRTWMRGPFSLVVLTLACVAFRASPAGRAEDCEVRGFPSVLRRDITLWSDGTRLDEVMQLEIGWFDKHLKENPEGSH